MVKMDIKIPTLADTIVSNKGRYYGAGCPVGGSGIERTVTGLDLHFCPCVGRAKIIVATSF